MMRRLGCLDPTGPCSTLVHGGVHRPSISAGVKAEPIGTGALRAVIHDTNAAAHSGGPSLLAMLRTASVVLGALLAILVVPAGVRLPDSIRIGASSHPFVKGHPGSSLYWSDEEALPALKDAVTHEQALGFLTIPPSVRAGARTDPCAPSASPFPTPYLTAWREGGTPPFAAFFALALFEHPPSVLHADTDLPAIAALGATGVVLPVLWSSPSVDSTSIEPFRYGVPQSEYDAAAVEIARRAHAMGLAFELRPIIRIERLGAGEWRGALRPSDRPAWWRAYRRFILQNARTAETARAEIFCIGSELGSTEDEREDWSRLIQDVRRVYHGRLIYSANWDHYTSVTFWDRLDGVGLSAYYELAAEPGASQESLDAAGKAQRDRILAWVRPIGKPLFLTEVGYPSQKNAAVRPWDYTQRGPADSRAQERCYRALSRAWVSSPELAGVTIWIWDHGKSGAEDSSYSIDGKPAAAVISDFFHARAHPCGSH